MTEEQTSIDHDPQANTPPSSRKGRPPMETMMLRVPTSTTLPRDVIAMIRERRWKTNELIQDGIDHREVCSKMDEKILKLNEIIQRQNEELDDFRAKMTESLNDIERCVDEL